MNEWLTEHLGLTYLAIVLCISFVYHKVFRVRKLPILKEMIVYIMILLGSVLLLIFQIDANLPILQSLLIAIIMMGIYRLRVFFLSKARKSHESQHSDHEG